MIDAKIYEQIIRKYALAAADQIKQQWSAYPDDMGNAKMSIENLDATIGTVGVILAAEGQKMWILEYGKGEFMDRDNPWLQQYLSSSFFNPARKQQGLKVLGRPKGVYYDLDGNRHFSNGFLEGIPLEEIGLRKFIDQQIGWPMKPRHIIENVLFGAGSGGIISEMRRELQEATGNSIRQLFDKLPKRIVIKSD